MQGSIMEQLWKTSHLSGGSAAYVEELYESYLNNPNSIPDQWRSYFEQLPSNGGDGDVSHADIKQEFLELARTKNRHVVAMTSQSDFSHEKKQIKVLQLINAYRYRGHQKAQLDPLGLMGREHIVDLELSYHGLSELDLETDFQIGSLFINKEVAPLKDIIASLEKTYCSTVGAEYMHIVDTSEKRWLQQRFEHCLGKPQYDSATKVHLLERLTAAEGLEKYLGSKYPGTKRFGLEGGESLIPSIDELIQRAGAYHVVEIVIGMAHRGRLNVLVNTMGKNPSELFEEFEGKSVVEMGSGDVKYHQGFSSNAMTPGGEIHLALSFNPSHLEIVSPVVEGSVRARQDRRKDPHGDKVLPIIVHGDSAFAGQGVVMETFQMSQTRAYKTGGTVHLVINNQVGFTTNKKEDTRSTEYCTDVAKMVQAPILHVNADDPEAVLFATRVALDYRMEFKKDVVVDLIGYRRRGHNEADEPFGTQPMMYQKIAEQNTTRTLYAQQLIDQEVITASQDKTMVNDYRDALDEGRHVMKSLVKKPDTKLFVDWTPYIGHDWTAKGDTTIALNELQRISVKTTTIPQGFVLQKQVAKIINDREKMAAGAMPINWGYAEVMAYATLAAEGYKIRLAGQDVGRGTFSHRHAVLHNQKDGATYVPVANISDEQGKIEIFDTFLSEEAVLGFEYGYATTSPDTLVIWEAQFGDFANGAQVVIDQFVTSGELKWNRLCGLTMLLPHGYEGQGPEHSSARLERYLQLSAEHNIQVCVPSTPAQVFHMIRRQAIRPLRKPLIVMSPKSLLRHKLAVSTLEDLCDGCFKTVLLDDDNPDVNVVTRVVMCSGKVYYDLLEKRRNENLQHVVLIRLEQLYPFPEVDLTELLKPYKNIKHVSWCQEEPQNQGAWYNSQHHMRRVIAAVDGSIYVEYTGRESSAAPAAGYMALHVKQQEKLLNDALGITKG